MDLPEGTWRLSGSVSLRPERFGAMAYDFATRRLSFLRSRTLVAVVEALGETPTTTEALVLAGVPADQHARYLRALGELAASGMLTRRPDPADVEAPA